MGYNIEDIDINDGRTEDELLELYKLAFQTPELLPKGHIHRNTVTPGTLAPGFFLAAVEDGKIIGVCGYLSTDFYCNGRRLAGYQSVWAATHPAHQGRGIFASLNREAINRCAENGGGMVYALAGDSSYPIFMKKLKFAEVAALTLKIPNLPFLRKAFIKQASINKTDALFADENQLYNLKKNTWGADVIRVDDPESDDFIWGRLLEIKLKFGITLRYFFVGGIDARQSGDVPKLFRLLFAAHKVHYVQIVSCASNGYNRFFTSWKKANLHGFLFYDVNLGSVPERNLFYGVIDVF